MVEIRLRAWPDGRLGLQVRGHALCGPAGQDVVCAAVSALALTAAETARRLHRQGLLAELPETVLRSGFAAVSVRPKGCARHRVRQQLQVIVDGLQLLEREFPRHVQVKGHL